MAEWPEADRPQPPPKAGPLEQRVSDADRDLTITLLRDHVGAGRLTLDEFSERMGHALEARTRGELDSVMAELPTASVSSGDVEARTRKSRRWHVAIMSGSNTRGRWRMAAETNAVAIMGGCEMDLRRAEIEGPEVVITAFAFWGGIQITVPEGFDVDLEGFSFMGGRSLRLRDVPLIPGSPRIRVRGFSIMGGIEVRSRPVRSKERSGSGDFVLDAVQSVVDALPEMFESNPHSPATPPQFATEPFVGSDHLDRIRQRREEGHREWERPNGGGRSHPRRSDGGPVSDGTVTILFSDMVDYAGMTERMGDRTSREVLHEHHRIVRHMLDRHCGREINVQGDGFMVAFGGVARALRCAIDVQRAFRSYSEMHLDRPIRVHIGVHTGDALEEEDDYIGHTVIVASRLASAALPGEILVSSLSAQLVEGTGEFTFLEQREAALKGMTKLQPASALVWG